MWQGSCQSQSGRILMDRLLAGFVGGVQVTECPERCRTPPPHSRLINLNLRVFSLSHAVASLREASHGRAQCRIGRHGAWVPRRACQD
jgi:hypothetical protein